MRKLCCFTFLFLVSVSAFALENGSASLTIIRPESEGLANAIPCLISLESAGIELPAAMTGISFFDSKGRKTNPRLIEGRLALLGGEKVLIILKPGLYRVRAETPGKYRYAYASEPEPGKSRQESITMGLAVGREYSLNVVPAVKNTNFLGVWAISQ